jgi:hypothetical protein
MDIILRALCDSYESVQKMRIAAENRLRAVLQRRDEYDTHRISLLENHVRDLENVEKGLVKQSETILSSYPIYTKFLSKVKGVGPKTSLRLLSLDLDIHKELSDWYAYFGLTPVYYACTCEGGHKILLPKDPRSTGATCSMKQKVGEATDEVGQVQAQMERCGKPIVDVDVRPPRRIKGFLHFWNPRAKKLVFLVSDWWLKNANRSFYGQYLLKQKQKAIQRGGKYVRDGRPSIVATLYGRRLAFKLFLAHVYQAWRELEGLPSRLPYSFEFLGHDDFISWQDVLRTEETMKKAPLEPQS